MKRTALGSLFVVVLAVATVGSNVPPPSNQQPSLPSVTLSPTISSPAVIFTDSSGDPMRNFFDGVPQSSRSFSSSGACSAKQVGLLQRVLSRIGVVAVQAQGCTGHGFRCAYYHEYPACGIPGLCGDCHAISAGDAPSHQGYEPGTGCCDDHLS